MKLISAIDRFDASWTAIERKEGQSLKELKSIATVRSVGASNRIEGNKMSDEEVDVLLQNIHVHEENLDLEGNIDFCVTWGKNKILRRH